MVKKIQISVIIPTYKDWSRLQLCLNALKMQSLDIHSFEIIVVNNDLNHQIPTTFKYPSNTIVLHEKKPGSYAARNTGIQTSQGEILAFTDSDCIPDKDWLKNALKVFENKKIQRVGGRIKLFYKDSKKRSPAELYESVFAFNQKENVKKRKLSVTANFFTRKDLFSSIGLFDSSKMSGEDWGWNRRATKLGIPIEYGSDIIVFHPARHKISELKAKTKRVASAISLNDTASKRLTYFSRILIDNLLKPLKRLFNEKLSLLKKFKIAILIFYLFVIHTLEYGKLLLGIIPKQQK